MKIISVLIIVCMILIINLAGCIDGEKTYNENEIYFQYPASWTTFKDFWPSNFGFEYQPKYDSELGAQELVGILDPNSSLNGVKYTTYAIIKKKNMTSSLESSFNNSYNTNNSSQIKILSKGSVQINGQTYYQLIYQTSRGELQYKVRDVWMEKNRSIYIVSCWALTSYDEEYSDNFNRIIKSFEVR